MTPVPAPLRSYLGALLDEFRSEEAGDIATYIPELGRADPDWFSICICTADGQVYEVGDFGVEFTIQSMSKPFVYGAALEHVGRDEVLARVGVEPSGNPFNAILVDDTNRPFNPMVNAGAIVTTAMVDSERHILDVLGRYGGRDLAVDEAVYRSELASGDRNRAIAFLMRSFGVIDGDADAAVDRYFRQCSVSVTCRDLAVMAATLANRGRNPVTDVVALDETHVGSVLSVMSTCGMYDASGDWMFRIGLPAKSGVSGGVLAVLPGQLGLGVFSPRLNEFGNSTRGIKVCERIAADFDLHPMRFQPDVRAVIRRSYTCAEAR
ncbi:MAG: glutaminase A, partial [Acidimicrobiales bacterium]